MPFVLGPLNQNLGPRSMLLVVDPSALMHGPSGVSVGALSLSDSVNPVSVVDIAIDVDDSALAVGLVVDPVALVECSVWVDLDSFAALSVSVLSPLALVLLASVDVDPVEPHQLLIELVLRILGELIRSHCVQGFPLLERKHVWVHCQVDGLVYSNLFGQILANLGAQNRASRVELFELESIEIVSVGYIQVLKL